MEYISISLSIIAIGLSTFAFFNARRQYSLYSYRDLTESFNNIIDAALQDSDLREIYENLFYNKPLSDKLSKSTKIRWAYLRVLNALERHFIESHTGFLKKDTLDPILESLTKKLIAKNEFYEIFRQAHYSMGFKDYIERLRLQVKEKLPKDTINKNMDEE